MAKQQTPNPSIDEINNLLADFRIDAAAKLILASSQGNQSKILSTLTANLVPRISEPLSSPETITNDNFRKFRDLNLDVLNLSKMIYGGAALSDTKYNKAYRIYQTIRQLLRDDSYEPWSYSLEATQAVIELILIVFANLYGKEEFQITLPLIHELNLSVLVERVIPFLNAIQEAETVIDNYKGNHLPSLIPIYGISTHSPLNIDLGVSSLLKELHSMLSPGKRRFERKSDQLSLREREVLVAKADAEVQAIQIANQTRIVETALLLAKELDLPIDERTNLARSLLVPLTIIMSESIDISYSPTLEKETRHSKL